MISRELFSVRRKGSPFDRIMDRSQAEGFRERRLKMGDAAKWEIGKVPSCLCCGEVAWPNRRCTKHQGRTPCVVDGCKRTTARHTTYFVCGQHWKAYVPPGSPERRVLNRLARLAKRLGYTKTERWPDHLERRWWRAWTAIALWVQRRSTEGHLDQAEIERLFGWTDG